jgi:hypothetical protein
VDRRQAGIQTEIQAAGKQYQANRQQRGQASGKDTERDRRQENSIKLTGSREDRRQAGIQTEKQAAGKQHQADRQQRGQAAGSQTGRRATVIYLYDKSNKFMRYRNPVFRLAEKWSPRAGNTGLLLLRLPGLQGCGGGGRSAHGCRRLSLRQPHNGTRRRFQCQCGRRPCYDSVGSP